jgi:hypothetical protein
VWERTRSSKTPKFPGLLKKNAKATRQGKAKQSREYCGVNQWTLDLVCPVEDDVVLRETKTTTDKTALFLRTVNNCPLSLSIYIYFKEKIQF